MKRVKLAVFIWLFAVLNVYSQADTKSMVSFSGEVSKKIVTGLEASFRQDFRLNAGRQDFHSTRSTLQVDYALIPGLMKVGTLYSFRRQLNDDRYYQSRHYWAFHANFKRKISFDWNASLRLRYQTNYREEYYKEYRVNPKNYLRTRLGVAYNFRGSRWAYSVSAEPYIYLNHQNNPLCDRLRYQVDADYRLGRYATLNGYVRFDNEIQVKEPVNMFMIGLVYKYRL
jgi:hypothetical protein